MNSKLVAFAIVLVACGQLVSGLQVNQIASGDEQQVVSALQHAAGGEQEESYQRVYEAFTKMLQNVSNNSLGNARRLVSRLNQLVGTSAGDQVSTPPTKQANVDEKTEQILTRLDQVNRNTDQHTLRQLQEDVNRLVGTLSESYLRNVRRVIERVNRTIGGSSGVAPLQPPVQASGALHQAADRYNENNGAEGPRQPGFPGWDELITAVDRMQKSLASFVRSSTKLITAGRRK